MTLQAPMSYRVCALEQQYNLPLMWLKRSIPSVTQVGIFITGAAIEENLCSF